MYRSACILAASFALGASLAGPTWGQNCDTLLPNGLSNTPAESRSLTIYDLIRLRDIGPVGASENMPVLAVSPDGSKVAFQLRRADETSNDYCLGMVVADLAKASSAHLVDQGGTFMRGAYDQYGLAHVPVGFAAIITPKWSPDGQWIAYLRRDNGLTQVWRARADGQGSQAVTRSLTDVEAFTWSDNGASITFSTTPDVEQREQAIQQEGETGYLFDDRFLPASRSTPYPRASLGRTYQTIDLASGAIHAGLASEMANLSPKPDLPDGVLKQAAEAGSLAQIASADARYVNSKTMLTVHFAAEDVRRCDSEDCTQIQELWWAKDGRTLYFLRRSGWGAEGQSIYSWRAGEAAAKRVWSSSDALIGCQYSIGHLICAGETSSQPRRIIQIDLPSGTLKTLFDPNPEFNRIKLGAVTRLHWKNNLGMETFGDLVVPPDHKPGDRHPLIIVGYESRGFLRGGTGDELPIQAFAARGFAVLSFQRPPDYGDIFGHPTSIDESERLDRVDWKDRWSVLSATESGVQAAVATGTVDGSRIGLSGFSDGSSSARFAMINGKVSYRAISLSHCCEDTTGLSLMNERARTRRYAVGYPRLSDQPTPFWSAYSVRLNVARFKTPMLIQTSDDEYLFAQESLTALKEAGQPVEMYVFPDETHVKWQPAHRLAVYDRNLDWFDFWLNDRIDPNPVKGEQYTRWQQFRQLPSQNIGAFHSG